MALVNTVIADFPHSSVVPKAIHMYSVLCQHPQFALYDEAVRCLQVRLVVLDLPCSEHAFLYDEAVRCLQVRNHPYFVLVVTTHPVLYPVLHPVLSH